MPCLRVDWLAYRSEDLQFAHIVFGGEILSELHQGADGGGSRVELGDLIFLHDLKELHGPSFIISRHLK